MAVEFNADILRSVMPPARVYTEVKGITPPVMEERDQQLVFLYLRWLTLRRAKDMGIVKLQSKLSELQAESKKGKNVAAAKLEAIQPGLSKATDWQFAGVVDLGSTRTPTRCIMGDAIRYAYYAYSPSFKQEIVFGRNCGSKFFNMDFNKGTAFIKQIEDAVRLGRREMRAVFLEGRYPAWLPFTRSMCIFQMLQKRPDLMEALYNTVGRTALELALNFLNRGWCLPEKLEHLIADSFAEVAKSKTPVVGNTGEARNICLKVAALDKDIILNKCKTSSDAPLISTRNQVTYPLLTTDTITAIEALLYEGMLYPTPASVMYDFPVLIQKYENLRALLKEITALEGNKYDVTRSQVLLAGMGNAPMGAVSTEYKPSLPFKNLVELLVFAIMTGDFGYLGIYLALNPMYYVYLQSDNTTCDEAKLLENKELLQTIAALEEKDVSDGSKLKSADNANISMLVYRLRRAFDAVWAQPDEEHERAATTIAEWDYDIQVRAKLQLMFAQYIDEITEELNLYLGEKKGVPAKYNKLVQHVMSTIQTEFMRLSTEVETSVDASEVDPVMPNYTDASLYSLIYTNEEIDFLAYTDNTDELTTEEDEEEEEVDD